MQLLRAILFVKDIQKMTSFYRDAFGLNSLGEPAGGSDWVELDAGGTALALHAIPASIAAGVVIADPPVRRGDTPIKLVFSADDLLAARTLLVKHGATMSEPSNWGSCDGVDPEGNVFQIVSR